MGSAEIPWRERIFVPVNFAAEITGVSRATVYRLRDDGKLIFRRIGGKTLVTVESLAKLVDNPDDWSPSDQGAAGRAKRRGAP